MTCLLDHSRASQQRHELELELRQARKHLGEAIARADQAREQVTPTQNFARSAAQLTVALVLQAIRKEHDNTGLKMQINALEGQLAAANSRAEDSAKVW